MDRTGPRFVLRAATATDHDRVDREFASYDLQDEAHYRSFLAAQAEAFLPVEAGLDRIDLARTLPDWPARRRSAALVADLAELGAAPIAPRDIPAYDSVAAALGAIYVLEGSRLGGAMLVRSVPAHLPRRFLGAGDSASWRKLVATLDATLPSKDHLTAAIGAARAVFARFEASARRHRESMSH